MLCNKCHQKEATVCFSEVKNKEKIQHHLCEDCAKEVADYIQQPAFCHSIHSIMSTFLEKLSAKIAEEETDIKCQYCGMTYKEFRKQGRLGCEYDYEIFQDVLSKFLRYIHGSNVHKGKRPPCSGENEAKPQPLARLQKALEVAIAEERYEEAASIRDQIRKLEGKNAYGPQ